MNKDEAKQILCSSKPFQPEYDEYERRFEAGNSPREYWFAIGDFGGHVEAVMQAMNIPTMDRGQGWDEFSTNLRATGETARFIRIRGEGLLESLRREEGIDIAAMAAASTQQKEPDRTETTPGALPGGRGTLYAQINVTRRDGPTGVNIYRG